MNRSGTPSGNGASFSCASGWPILPPPTFTSSTFPGLQIAGRVVSNCPGLRAGRSPSRRRPGLSISEKLPHLLTRAPVVVRCDGGPPFAYFGGCPHAVLSAHGSGPGRLKTRQYSQSLRKFCLPPDPIRPFFFQMTGRHWESPLLYHSQTSPSHAGQYSPLRCTPDTTHTTGPRLTLTASIVISNIHSTHDSQSRLTSFRP